MTVENRDSITQREPIAEATIGALLVLTTVGIPLAAVVESINVQLGMEAALPIVTVTAIGGGLWGLFHS